MRALGEPRLFLLRRAANDKGTALSQVITVDEARRLIEKALAMAPDDAAILDSMGWVLFRQGDPAGALTYLERSYERQKDPEIAAHMGEVLWALGRKDDARRVLREAQEKFPANQVLSDTARRLAL